MRRQQCAEPRVKLETVASKQIVPMVKDAEAYLSTLDYNIRELARDELQGYNLCKQDKDAVERRNRALRKSLDNAICACVQYREDVGEFIIPRGVYDVLI